MSISSVTYYYRAVHIWGETSSTSLLASTFTTAGLANTAISNELSVNYEQRTVNGTVSTYHYVSSPDGLVAIYVKQGSGAMTPYYVETDHLGSICKIYDASGNQKFSAAYDPWGKQTVNTKTLDLRRGYTGHEHWNEFGLIDMNGRFYDPVVARFLSPDPYVQDPSTPQNFNRYSYCLNNPLKYTDPSGETIAGAIVCCACIYFGGVIANAEYSNNPMNPGQWNWKSGSTYVGMANGLVQGLGACRVSMTISGAFSNGMLQAGIGVGINGIGNVIDGDDFLEDAWLPGLTGFAYGFGAGYAKAKANGKNVWWGNEVKYGRTQYSFFTSEKPLQEVKFKIKGCNIAELNNCVPATFTEINDHFGENANYNQIAAEVNYAGNGTSGGDYRAYMNKHYDYEQIEIDKLESFTDVNKIKESGGIISSYSPAGGIKHADVVRKISYYTSGNVRVHLRIGSFNTSSMNSSDWTFYQINGLK